MTSEKDTGNDSRPYYDLTFDEMLQQEISVLREGVPVVIFRKEEYHDDVTRANAARLRKIEVPFVFYLDGCHGNIETITQFESRQWPIVYAQNLDVTDQDKEIQSRFKKIRAHLDSRSMYTKDAPTVVPAGIEVKARAAAEASRAKEKTNAIKKAAIEGV